MALTAAHCCQDASRVRQLSSISSRPRLCGPHWFEETRTPSSANCHVPAHQVSGTARARPSRLSCRRRSLAASAFAASGAGSPEKALRTTVELDKLIDTLRNADPQQMPQLIAENIFSFDQTFWLRLATRADTCSSQDDRRDFEELSQTVMTIVERLVRCTEERMDTSSDRLAELLNAAHIGGQSGEIVWPPSDPSTIQRLREEISRRDQDGSLDDSLLASISAQLRQASEKGDRPGLAAMLQKVLQLYAATRLGRRSYARKEDGSEDAAEKLLEDILQAEVESWDACLQQGLALGGGQVPEDKFFEALELRGKRMLMRTESGSYEQRILGEYLAELEARAKNAVEAFQST